LNEWIENKYGKDSIAMLVDEGSGTEDIYGQVSRKSTLRMV
jgi:hypothetical protein